MYRARIPPAAGDEAEATFGSVLEAHTSLSVSRRKLLASSSGLFSKHDSEQNESFGAAWQPRAARGLGACLVNVTLTSLLSTISLCRW